MGKDDDIQQAINSIALIRQVIRQADADTTDAKLSGITLDANLLVQLGVFFIVLALSLLELFTAGSMTETISSGSKNPELMLVGIGLMGFIVAGLVLVLYFVIWRAARHNGEELGSYIRRNFRYMYQLSLVSDLLMKFICLALLILAGKALWIAPVLLAFTADYLFQARLFTLPSKAAVSLGVLCLGLGTYQFFVGSPALLVPLLTFSIVAGLSAGRLVLRYRSQMLAGHQAAS
ncbi:hypothetical protein [Undibacterium sp. Tian12W]|uniref:hypothetical protein n=1 Tax=Undibacterium sp. Tian12W TaxID=3413054 RepID=UPI003BEFE557